MPFAVEIITRVFAGGYLTWIIALKLIQAELR